MLHLIARYTLLDIAGFRLSVLALGAVGVPGDETDSLIHGCRLL